MQIIDSHQHFWIYDPKQHAWIDDSMQSIRQDYTPAIFEALLIKNQVTGSITVQVDQTEQETHLLIEEAKQNQFIKGVVGWIDLKNPAIDSQLTEWIEYKQYLKGFRHILQSEPDSFMLDQQFINGLKALAKQGFTYDLLIKHHQLPAAIQMVEQVPTLSIVLDHIAKPDIKHHQIEQWAKDIKRLAAFPNVYCKISGMVTEADWQLWDNTQISKYIDIVLENFGINRIMFGSDWPVCLLASTYERWLETMQQYFQSFSSLDQQKIFADNCSTFYHL